MWLGEETACLTSVRSHQTSPAHPIGGKDVDEAVTKLDD